MKNQPSLVLSIIVLCCTVSTLTACNNAQSLNCDPNDRALQKAAGKGDEKKARELVEEKRADITATCGQHPPAFIRAAHRGHLHILKYLVAQGQSVNIQDENGRTALMTATRYGHLSVVKYLTTHKADLNIRSENGRTALIEAAQQNRLFIASFLLEQRADIDIQDRGGYTALMRAIESPCAKKNIPLITLLIKETQNFHLKTKDGLEQTVLDIAEENLTRATREVEEGMEEEAYIKTCTLFITMIKEKM